jgi:ADP-ribose pyrophosphatase YjhB (NUDIX family)
MARVLARVWRRLPYALQWMLCWLFNSPFLVGVMGVVVNDRGQVLILDHAYRRGPSWGLPSGWMQPGEWTQAAIFREIKEETGLLVDVGPLLLAASAVTRNRLDIAYLCQVQGGTPHLSHEVVDMRFCEPDSLPEAMYPAQRAIVQLAQAHSPDWFEGRIEE